MQPITEAKCRNCEWHADIYLPEEDGFPFYDLYPLHNKKLTTLKYNDGEKQQDTKQKASTQKFVIKYLLTTI